MAKESVSKVSGAFHPSYYGDYRYTLLKDSSGKWKINDIELLSLHVYNIDGLWTEAVEVPVPDKIAIEAVAAAQMKAINDKNLSGHRDTFLPETPGLQTHGSLTTRDYNFGGCQKTRKRGLNHALRVLCVY